MASERLTFTLEGRDDLSRVLGHAGESAQRLQRTMQDASDGSGQAILTLTQDADGRLRDMEGRFLSAGDAAALMGTRAEESARSVTTWADAADRAGKAGNELKKSLLTLAPAAVPMAASLAPLTGAVLAGATGVGIFAVALGKQVSAMSDAAEAEKKYNDAVEESGAASAKAVQAQIAYAKTMAAMPPATREAAAALSLFKDEYSDWSDSLAEDTTAPLIKGMATLQGIFPKLTPTVKGAAAELDRLVTIAGAGVASPGFDSFMGKVDQWSTGALRRANDALVQLLRTADGPAISGGIAEFMAFAREQGPAVSATLRSLGEALLNVLDAGADVGVGMLAVVQALSQLVAAVPPEVITALLQLAIAVRAVNLAVAGTAAARVAVGAFATQIVAMRTAAAGAPGPLAAAGAAITTLSRTAKLAIAGTGIGLLVIALSELAMAGEQTPIDVDKLTLSLVKLGDTGQVTGAALAEFGEGFGELKTLLGEVVNPSVTESINNWGAEITGGFLDAGAATEELTPKLDAVDKSLTSLVAGGKADLAAAALRNLLRGMDPASADKVKSSLDEYNTALENSAYEAKLAAEAQGLFGAQAQETQAKLDQQKTSADGLRQAIQALNDVNRAGISAEIAFEQALDNTTKAAEENKGAWSANASVVDLTTDKGRAAATALNDLAAKTDAAAGAARESGASWTTVNGIYERGRLQLVANAQQMGLNKTAAERLADQILRTPDKTAKLKGNIEDLQAKLDAAKKRLSSVPDSRRAAIRAEISQLESQIARAKGAIASVHGKTVSVMIDYRTRNSGASDFTKSIGGYAGGGTPRPGETFWVGENGPELMTLGRGGSARVYDHQTSMNMVSQPRLGRDVGAGLVAGMDQSRSSVERAARALAAGVEAGVRSELQIASPSKKAKQLMGHWGDGMLVGLREQKGKIENPVKALMADLKNGIVRGLTGTRAQIKATALDLNKDIWAAWSKRPRSTEDTALVRMVNREHDKLQRLAARRDSVRTRLGDARELLSDRIEERAKYRTDVRNQVLSASSLSSLGLEPRQVTRSSIKQGLGQKLSRLQQFARWIGILTKRGINRNLLRQVIAMGPEEGYAYASALAGMTTADLKAVNSIQSRIDKESDTFSKKSASTMYDAGVNSAQGLVKGLASQQKAIEAQMLKIAKGMEKALKKALGIQSPSRVAHAIGANFGQSTGSGVLSTLPAVGQAVDAVAARMVGIRPVPGRPVAGLGVAGGAAGMTVNVHIEGAMDPVRVGQEVQRVLLKLKRTNGVNVQLGVA